jgi:hypothetical protein
VPECSSARHTRAAEEVDQRWDSAQVGDALHTRSVRIGFVPADAAADEALVQRLVDVVNRAYAQAEVGMWRNGYLPYSVGRGRCRHAARLDRGSRRPRRHEHQRPSCVTTKQRGSELSLSIRCGLAVVSAAPWWRSPEDNGRERRFARLSQCAGMSP